MPISNFFTLRRAWIAAFWAALLFAFVMAILPKPPQIPGSPSDKLLHIVAFLTLTALAVAAFRETSLIAIGVRLSAFGVLIELVQMIPALRRDGDVIDWAADTLAVAVVLLATAARRSAARKAPTRNSSPGKRGIAGPPPADR